MASDRERVRDMRYGRRGGGWVSPDTGRTGQRTGACDVCGGVMMAGQRGRHHSCDPETVAGLVCVCPPGCTDLRYGDGPRECEDPDGNPCRVCSMLAGQKYDPALHGKRPVDDDG